MNKHSPILPKLAASLLSAGFVSPVFAASTITHAGTNFVSSQNNTVAGVNWNISVESSYAGFKGEYDDGGGSPGASSSTAFNNPVAAYRFWSSSNTAISTLAQGGGLVSDLTTTDTTFQGQSQVSIWETTAPNGSAFDTTPNYAGNIGNLDEGASGSINISGLSAGSIYFFYGSYRSTAIFNVDLTTGGTTDLHNGDFANNNEWYVAQVDFVNEGDLTTVDWSMGSGFNGRLSGIVVTAVPEPSAAALLCLGVLGLMARRRR